MSIRNIIPYPQDDKIAKFFRVHRRISCFGKIILFVRTCFLLFGLFFKMKIFRTLSKNGHFLESGHNLPELTFSSMKFTFPQKHYLYLPIHLWNYTQHSYRDDTIIVPQHIPSQTFSSH